ncbi:very short patch repair endonuclease [Lysobacter sp. Root983]|uniref:very short patch repair endonuclease n=1 Tax=Lysobacter sp. Root983 TaxID=1736613 RepID=UPI0009EBB45D|nr:very short patch repair endonuclease [Lysobacter sp. Root983]
MPRTRTSKLAGVTATTSARMSKVAQRHNARERALRSELHHRGLRFRLDRPFDEGSRRTVDVLSVAARIAVFVDGCFWHGCPQHGTLPKNNAEWWQRKIEGSIARDRDTTARLELSGWQVIRVWEHEPLKDTADRIALAVRRAMTDRR